MAWLQPANNSSRMLLKAKTGRSLLNLRVNYPEVPDSCGLQNQFCESQKKLWITDATQRETMTHFIALRTTGGHELLLNIAHIVSVVQDFDDDLCSIWTSATDGQSECYHVHGTASGILELINLLQRGN